MVDHVGASRFAPQRPKKVRRAMGFLCIGRDTTPGTFYGNVDAIEVRRYASSTYYGSLSITNSIFGENSVVVRESSRSSSYRITLSAFNNKVWYGTGSYTSTLGHLTVAHNGGDGMELRRDGGSRRGTGDRRWRSGPSGHGWRTLARRRRLE